ncbi:MAG: leucine dehydrogenase [Bacteroidia bacterium]|nr:leucine dehydrogenase [Bacteroidia bacterium]
MQNISPLSEMEKYGHEQVVFFNDPQSGLKSIVAIHNTTLGPALGGLRMWNYENEQQALWDVLRLSRGMTYKSSLAGINLGGGKAVIMGDPQKQKTEALLRSLGKFIHSLSGKYITAEDVSMNSSDMEIIRMETPYVTGLPHYMGGSGDPSPVTAYGVYISMKASAKFLWGKESLHGKKILVQGLGHVGTHLVEHLASEGAEIWVYDLFEEKIKSISSKYKVHVAKSDNLYALDIDIYAPCALGATLNSQTLNQLKCAIVCGAANNQLEDEEVHGKLIGDKGILYAPDFVANAGGIINVYYELSGYNKERAMAHAERIYGNILKVLQMARDLNIPTYLAANRLAEERINAIARIKTRL